MVAQNCWEEYLANVHKAVPMDPWDTTLQLFDVLVDGDANGSAHGRSLWSRLRKLFRNSKRSKATPVQVPDRAARAGSFLALGVFSDGNVEKAIYNGLSRLNDGAATDSGLSSSSSLSGSVSTTAFADSNSTLSTDSNASMPILEDWFKGQSLPDINTSITSSTSLLGSLSVPSTSVSSQFDAMDSKKVKCNITGVKSNRVNEDALMKLVGMSNAIAKWKPDISQTQLGWCPERGKTLWVLTEIMYANKIEIEAEKSLKADTKGSVKAEGGIGASNEKDVRWSVSSSSSSSSSFPFAFKVLRLDYDGNGNIVSARSVRKSQSMRKLPENTCTSQSLNQYITSSNQPYYVSLSDHHNLPVNLQSFDRNDLAITNPSFEITTHSNAIACITPSTLSLTS